MEKEKKICPENFVGRFGRAGGNTHLWHPNGRFLVPGRLRRRPGTFMRAAPSSAQASLICPGGANHICECASAPAATNQRPVCQGSGSNFKTGSSWSPAKQSKMEQL